MKQLAVLVALCLFGPSFRADGQIPRKISYQGLLTTSTGAPVASGNYDLKFEFFDAPAGGSLRASMSLSGVGVERGTFNVVLDTLPASFGESLYVQVTALAGPGIGSPIAFLPRSELTSAPYALAPWTPSGSNLSFTGGNVGIGTSVPGYRLDVNGVVNATDIYKNGSPFAGASQWTTSGSDIYYSAGRVGIGTTTPLSQLHVRGSNPVRIVGDLATLAGTEYVDFMARNSPYGTDIGGMRVRRDSTTGDVNTMIYAAASGFAASEKMRVRGNGNVGIGTATPTSKLEIAAQDGLAITGTQPFLTLRDASASNARTLISNVAGGLNFFTNTFIGSNPPMTIRTGSGNVGIGTTNPQSQLHVYSTAFPSYAATVEDNLVGGSAWGLQVTATAAVAGGEAYAISAGAYGASTRFAGYFTGDLAYTGSLIHPSDQRLKDHIEPYTGGLAAIMSLTPRTFTYRTGPEFDHFSFSPGRHFGFIAQEVEQTLPELVTTAAQPPERDAQGALKNERVAYKALRPLELIPILVEAVQEQQKLIQDLQAKIRQLESK